jgi:8-oxo-dGTP pyrophosphatase MutT (NUDIX family)
MRKKIRPQSYGFSARKEAYICEKPPTCMHTPFRTQGPDNSENPWQTLQTETVYENPWIEVTHRAVINPSGGSGIYGMVRFKNLAIGIVPLDAAGYTWLVGQYRYPLQRYSWEIPEGGSPVGQSALESARRELEEETGLQARVWTPILEMHLSNSVTDEFAAVFVAQELTQGPSRPEPTEQLQLRRVRLEEAVEMVMRGEITDSISVAALLKTSELIRRGELAF